MTVKKQALLVAAMVIATLNGHGQNVNSLLSEWSVVTSDNLMMVNDIQGLAYVGGNVTVPNSFNVATGSSSIPNSTISLAVGGNIDNGGNLQVNGGSVVAGGSIDRTINMNSGGTYKANDPTGLPASPVGAIASASRYWSTLSANSTTSENAGQQLVFNCEAGASVAIFNISASQMFNFGYQGFVLMPAESTEDVLINVEGANVNWTSGNFASEFNTPTWDTLTMFNFYDATNVSLSGLIGGYVVAPDANVMLGNNIDGGIMASNLTVDSEVDLPSGSSTSAWEGALPVPEPSTLALAGIGGLGMLFVLCRRRLND